MIWKTPTWRPCSKCMPWSSHKSAVVSTDLKLQDTVLVIGVASMDNPQGIWTHMNTKCSKLEKRGIKLSTFVLELWAYSQEVEHYVIAPEILPCRKERKIVFQPSFFQGQAVKLRVCTIYTMLNKKTWSTYKWIQRICPQKKNRPAEKLAPLHGMRHQKKTIPRPKWERHWN